MEQGWQFWIDRGGTFTDVVARDCAGRLHVRKLLSDNPAQYDDAPLHAIRLLLEIPPGAPIPPERIHSVKMGTTLATNALLERRGARVALVVTEGFGDLLEIGYQDRPDIFALDIQRPGTLAETVVEARERVLADGTVRTPLDAGRLREDLAAVRSEGIDAIAVLFLHSYARPDHELAAGAIATELGFAQVSLSHSVSRSIRAVPRGDTTTVDACLTPVLRGYIAKTRAGLGGAVTLRFMQSDGTLADAERFSGHNAILSGPAGGVTAFAELCRRAGFDKAIGFDMGGTSTDVSRVDVEPERVYEKQTAGVRIHAPMLWIETVAAGGGSLLRFDGHRMTVGPDSAGAFPGPACYRHGGPATITDANLVLGRIQPDYFPACFGPGADEPLDPVAARVRLMELAGAISDATGAGVTPEEAAAGFVRIANENMAKPIRAVSVARGFDVREYALACFGGAGPQHACALAASLGIADIVISPFAGVLSAYGMGLAPLGHDSVTPVLRALDDAAFASLEPLYQAMEAEGRRAVLLEGAHSESVLHVRWAELRYLGTDAVLHVLMNDTLAAGRRDLAGFAGKDAETLDLLESMQSIAPRLPASAAELREEFETLHQKRHGMTRPGHPVELVHVRVHTMGETELLGPEDDEIAVLQRMRSWLQEHREAVPLEEPDTPQERKRRIWAGPMSIFEDTRPKPVSPDLAADRVTVFFDQVDARGVRQLTPLSAPVFRRKDLTAWCRVEGPALIADEGSTIVIDPGWSARQDSAGNLILSGASASPEFEQVSTRCEPVMLEVFNNLFMAAAEQMGHRLEHVSHSVNIRERHDFSCAIFDPNGALVANAPHIPVHLGAMGESVKAVLAEWGDRMRPGDVYATNDPYGGGSHLPDVTVVTPVYSESGERIFFVANRGHHADIGGISPGSMPPFSRQIDEEGVVLRNVPLVREGRFDREGIVARLQSGPWPARDIGERLNDLEAQVAANLEGVEAINAICAKYGVRAVHAYMGHVRANASAVMRAMIRELPDGLFRHEDTLDCGARIRVSIVIDGARAIVDFAGTSPQLEGNLNAPAPVTLSAVLYVFRTLVGKAIPLNSGCLEPISVRIPEGCLLNPRPPAAVVGGNVETSMRVCDVLYGALGRAAASQGTMNNITFGNDAFGYYETVCGGAGAGPGFHGACAVHTHMTNTRITDPEILERRYPVVLRSFAVRRGSGGAGQWNGGDGVVREIEFREALSAAVLSERRTTRPFGLAGGAPGAAGRNRLLRADGAEEALGGHAAFEVRPGDILRIETPGGGGFGMPCADHS